MEKTFIKAKIAQAGREHGRNYGGEKELVGAWTLVCKAGREMKPALAVRTYMGRSRNASTVYASVWINPGKPGREYQAGTGSAGGYGYHKESQAIADAIADAGFELYGSPYRHSDKPVNFKNRVRFGGTGSTAYLDIFKAIAKAQGFNVTGALLVEH